MIRVGFYLAGKEPTVFIHLESPADFQDLCTVMSKLADGVYPLVKTTEHPEMFKSSPEIHCLTFAATWRSGRTKFTFNATDITWEMARDGWQSALKIIRALHPCSHNYLEYDDATVEVSYMERLREGIHTESGSGLL